MTSVSELNQHVSVVVSSYAYAGDAAAMLIPSTAAARATDARPTRPIRIFIDDPLPIEVVSGLLAVSLRLVERLVYVRGEDSS